MPKQKLDWMTAILAEPDEDEDEDENGGYGPSPAPGPTPAAGVTKSPATLATEQAQLRVKVAGDQMLEWEGKVRDADAEVVALESQQKIAAAWTADPFGPSGMARPTFTQHTALGQAKAAQGAAKARLDYFRGEYSSALSALNATRAKELSTTISAASKQLDQAAKARQSYLSDALAAGRLRLDQAQEEWDRDMDASKAWTSTISAAWKVAAKLGPQMSTQEDLDALMAAVREWSKFGAAPIPEGYKPRIIPLDAIVLPFIEAVKPYLPPLPGWQSKVAGGIAAPMEPTASAFAQVPPPAARPQPQPESGLWGPANPEYIREDLYQQAPPVSSRPIRPGAYGGIMTSPDVGYQPGGPGIPTGMDEEEELRRILKALAGQE